MALIFRLNLHAPSDTHHQLYDYQTDPLETENLAAKKPEIVAELKQTLTKYPPPIAPFNGKPKATAQ